MLISIARTIRLERRPEGLPKLSDFKLVSEPLRSPGPGEVQVRNRWLSVDPYMRQRMYDRPSYIPPFQLGAPLDGGAVGEVVASLDPAFHPGDLVQSMLGWRDAFTSPASVVQKIDAGVAAPQAFLGVAGVPGLTAYIGLLMVAAIKPGDIVLVSAAAGAVGAMACQIAKLKGGTVIGLAGGAAKTAYLREIGVAHAIDYKAADDLPTALARAAPDGIDIYFDNVGGTQLQAALDICRDFARVVICGMISQYNNTGAVAGPSNMGQVIARRLRLEGFIVSDHFGSLPQFHQDLASWIADKRITWRETVEIGLAAMPQAFIKLFTGENIGKMLVYLQ